MGHDGKPFIAPQYHLVQTVRHQARNDDKGYMGRLPEMHIANDTDRRRITDKFPERAGIIREHAVKLPLAE